MGSMLPPVSGQSQPQPTYAQLQADNQIRLARLANRYLQEIEQNQHNPVMGQMVANLAIASGMGGNVNFHA